MHVLVDYQALYMLTSQLSVHTHAIRIFAPPSPSPLPMLEMPDHKYPKGHRKYSLGSFGAGGIGKGVMQL